ncbi:cytochrome c oxidase, cbb3-type, CcoQ subunit [Campylobacter canadensis]|uniref:Cytochrome c oxidase, cbb3-type, CcoQ subunit n=1 Tax=Campylobacter canadensis TaxID=449520 RepID=A0ABS7WQB8_9BACT|nr:cytochrome c oxidase, cbb3-type, CcoQ subunit [Campylobacter canadensis]MBZ7986971.1 cytochrome c oxidase, cbb3-type, CcoQ subunit [Campylobacter canadensis]MBZ7994290.1 cytochrome c oxidase, cbb3-type, CcoQ subunit [Campylobacter canadensis]MBZ7995718.1 cytochrome c oxidase, cbb3-type, CcoQ subunit [Campylobacter canadensis]MBZ7998007.1 cytochrome c oxidase, cbb3-type, CcoQ subunit [Campylobacter canadensis]MBZ7999622.1 cytochrome c oxidase, cbb3-type, CcoQ subunit [Campylobacter canadensi
MSFDEFAQLQGHFYFFLIFFLTIVLYAYIFHLYKTQKSGKKDYEKYANLALNDDLDSELLERRAK